MANRFFGTLLTLSVPDIYNPFKWVLLKLHQTRGYGTLKKAVSTVLHTFNARIAAFLAMEQSSRIIWQMLHGDHMKLWWKWNSDAKKVHAIPSEIRLDVHLKIRWLVICIKCSQIHYAKSREQNTYTCYHQDYYLKGNFNKQTSIRLLLSKNITVTPCHFCQTDGALVSRR